MPKMEFSLDSLQAQQLPIPSKFTEGFNVKDELKGLNVESIKDYVQALTFPAMVAVIRVTGDFNYSSVIRNANAFGFRKVFNIGDIKKWDRRGACGTHHYTDVEHYERFEHLWMKYILLGYSFIALENNIDYSVTSLYEFEWPEKTLLIVGEEGQGLSDDVLKKCQHIVEIPQYGSVRSINLSTASGIAMNAYARQWS